MPVRSLPGGRLPAFATRLPALARMADGDLLYASKPRITSAGIGYLARLAGLTSLSHVTIEVDPCPHPHGACACARR